MKFIIAVFTGLLLLPDTSPLLAQTDPSTENLAGCSIELPVLPKGLGYKPGRETWPGGIIPYHFDFEDASDGPRLREIMEEAILRVNERTNVCWIPSTSAVGAVRIIRSKRSYNYATLGFRSPTATDGRIGMISRSVGVGMHEMFHVMGILHEQQRPDRDDHVTIHYDEVEDEQRHNFNRVPTSVASRFLYDTPYDLASIMHYGSYAFSKTRQPTITAKNRANSIIRANRDKMSDHDIEQVNAMYPEAVSDGECDALIARSGISVAVEVANRIDWKPFCPEQIVELSVTELTESQQGNSYRWEAVGGTPSGGTGPDLNVTYRRPGRKKIKLHVERGIATKTYEVAIEVLAGQNEIAVVGNPVPPGSPIRYRISNEEQDFTLYLFNAGGQQVWSRHYAHAECRSEGTIPSNQLSAGVYWLHYIRGDDTFGVRVVVM